MNISCIIVEDEPLALERTKAYVQKLPFLDLLAAFDNGIDALVYLRSHPVDLLFLDIRLDGLSGMQLLEATDIKSQIIITTAYPEHALKGYELNVTDYLLKPFTFERFFQAVEKAQRNLANHQRPGTPRFLFVKTERRLEKVLLREILYIEGMRDYRCVHTVNKRIMTLRTFKEFEVEIPARIVCRVHKSYMVSLDKIDSIERDRIRIKENVIPISETYKKRLFELIKLTEN